MLLGRLPYHKKGILDETHLHFYTLKTAERMLQKTGWQVKEKDVTTIPLSIVFPFLLKGPFRILPWSLSVITHVLKGLFAYQGIFICVNPNSPDLL